MIWGMMRVNMAVFIPNGEDLMIFDYIPDKESRNKPFNLYFFLALFFNLIHILSVLLLCNKTKMTEVFL